jgi:hypothetical protein
MCLLFPEFFKRLGFGKERRNAVVRIYIRGYLPEDMATGKVPKDTGCNTKKNDSVSPKQINSGFTHQA